MKQPGQHPSTYHYMQFLNANGLAQGEEIGDSKESLLYV